MRNRDRLQLMDWTLRGWVVCWLLLLIKEVVG